MAKQRQAHPTRLVTQGPTGIIAPPYYPRIPASTAYQMQASIDGLGAGEDIEREALRKGFNTIPAFFTVTIDLAGTTGANQAGSVPLRPEPFICKRITWATNGDLPSIIGPDAVSTAGSVQGRCVEATWQDEFTQFMGQRPCLLSALFADSQGFIDFPKPILLQGKQTLTVNLRRLSWPAVDTGTYPPSITRFDFNFQGLSVLPAGVNQSGTAG
jgi:hypothetical protein